MSTQKKTTPPERAAPSPRERKPDTPARAASPLRERKPDTPERAAPSLRRERKPDAQARAAPSPRERKPDTPARAAPSLRERKKAQTRLAISDVATRLFIERGFEQVTVAEVAESANVSVNTVFNYFSTKEELFFDRGGEFLDAPSRIVRERKRGESAVAALRRSFRKAMRGDTSRVFGGQMKPFFATVEKSPALQARARLLFEQAEQRLLETLIEATGAAQDDATARALAALITGTLWMLAREFRQRLLADEPETALREAIARLGERSFELLLRAAGDYATRADDP